jgi:tetratricopeptide (TPR) repeat protein
MALLKGTYLVETGLWDSSIARIPVDVSDLNISLRSQYGFQEGMKAFTSGNKEQLGETIASMKKDNEFETVLSKEGDGSFCMSANRGQASRTDIDQSRVMEMQLRGILASIEGNRTETEEWFKKSVELDDSISYSYGPPTIQKPSHELYAEWLLDQGRSEEALRQFDLALERAPRRVLTLQGKRRAATAAGNESLAGEIDVVLSEIGVGVKR